VVFAGDVFLPAGQLRYLAPWTAESRPPWNPLWYDSIGQFFPWRSFASETIRSGYLPLWNPYQFSGAPFVANSQSAVFYPGNLLFLLMDPARAAGWTVILHLTLAACFMRLFIRRTGGSPAAGLLGGVVFAFSTWQVSWLHLPTFLCTSCWLPLALGATLALFEKPTWRRCVALGFAVAMTLLAGHLQVAFYVLLAAFILAIWLTVPRRTAEVAPTNPAIRPLAALALFAAALALAGMAAAPQLLPTLELSRQSHRVSSPSTAGYAAYTDYAVGAHSLITAFLPDFFGNPSDTDSPYVGTSRGGKYFNYAEGALYVGLPTLVLAGIGLFAPRPSRRLRGYLGALALLSLLMALGTAVDALFYFYVPGFGQSGSPGRSLLLWSFTLSALAAMGYDRLAHKDSAPVRHVILVTAGLTVAMGVLASIGIGALRHVSAEMSTPAVIRSGALLLLSAGVCRAIASGWMKPRLLALLVGLVGVDLFAVGINYNPTAKREEVYPATALTDTLRQQAGHDRIMPVNTRNFSFLGPDALLPPNGAMVFGLRDVQGYDSLFPGRYKAFLNQLAAPVAADASPPEVGNMVFAKNPASPLALAAGVRWVASQSPLDLPGSRSTMANGIYLYELTGAPGRASATDSQGRPVPVTWVKDSPTHVALSLNSFFPSELTLADELYPGWSASVDGRPVAIGSVEGVFRNVAVPAGSHTVRFTFEPAALRVGLFLMLVVVAVAVFTVVTGMWQAASRTQVKHVTVPADQ
jgi:hypothetical protein